MVTINSTTTCSFDDYSDVLTITFLNFGRSRQNLVHEKKFEKLVEVEQSSTFERFRDRSRSNRRRRKFDVQGSTSVAGQVAGFSRSGKPETFAGFV